MTDGPVEQTSSESVSCLPTNPKQMSAAKQHVPRIKGTGLWVLMMAILVLMFVLALASQHWYVSNREPGESSWHFHPNTRPSLGVPVDRPTSLAHNLANAAPEFDEALPVRHLAG